MTAHGAADAGGTAGHDLARLAEESWEGTLAAQPVMATSIGDRRFDDRLADVRRRGQGRRTQPARPARRAGAGHPGRRPGVVRRGQPPGPHRVPRGGARPGDRRRGELGGRPARRPAGPAPQPVVVPAGRHPGRRRPARCALAGDGPVPRRRRRQPARRARTRASSRREAPVRAVIDELDDLLDRPDGAEPLLAPATADRTGWSAAEQRRFASELDAAVREAVLPAFGRYRRAGRRGGAPARATERPPRPRPSARRRRRLPAARPGPHLARPGPRGDPRDRPRRGRADRRRARRARRAGARDRATRPRRAPGCAATRRSTSRRPTRSWRPPSRPSTGRRPPCRTGSGSCPARPARSSR